MQNYWHLGVANLFSCDSVSSRSKKFPAKMAVISRSVVVVVVAITRSVPTVILVGVSRIGGLVARCTGAAF
jgi:hypothetical protein